MHLQNFLKKLPLVYLLFGLNTSLFSSSLDADKNKLQKELDYQVKATSEFQSITKPAIDEAMASHVANAKKRMI